MTPWKHAESSAKRFGGEPRDYIHLHNWFDETKQYTGDWTHRALRHHAAGVEWAIRLFGHWIETSDGKEVPTKSVAEQHIMEDCGFIPTVERWLSCLRTRPEPWMLKVQSTTSKPLEIGEPHVGTGSVAEKHL